MVDAYVVSHLQESLGLSDAQYAKALPLVTKLQADRRDVRDPARARAAGDAPAAQRGGRARRRSSRSWPS